MHFLSILLILHILRTFAVGSTDSELTSDAFLPMPNEFSDLGQEFDSSKDPTLVSIPSGGITDDCNDDGFLPIKKVRAQRSQCSNPLQVATPEQITTPPEDEMTISQGGNIIDGTLSNFFSPGLDDGANLELSTVPKAVCPAHARLKADKKVPEQNLRCIDPEDPDFDFLNNPPFLPPKDEGGACDRFKPESRWVICDSGNPKDKIGPGLTLKNSFRGFMISGGGKLQLTLRSTEFYTSTRGCSKPKHQIYCCMFWYMTNTRKKVHTLSLHWLR